MLKLASPCVLKHALSMADRCQEDGNLVFDL
jgi:hypothetical protein